MGPAARAQVRRTSTGGDPVPAREITVRRLRRSFPRLRGCFERLPARQRRVLSLRGGLSGSALSRAEVAERLGTPATSVARAERRGLRRLRVLARDGCGVAVLGAFAVGSDPARGGGGGSTGPPASGLVAAARRAAVPRGFGPQVGAPLRRIATAPSAERVPVILGTLADGPEGFSRPVPPAGAAADPPAGEGPRDLSVTTGLGLLGLLVAAIASAAWLLVRRRRQNRPRARRTSHVPPDPA